MSGKTVKEPVSATFAAGAKVEVMTGEKALDAAEFPGILRLSGTVKDSSGKVRKFHAVVPNPDVLDGLVFLCE